MAILVRAIFQTKFEERFLKIGLPYRILGGTNFMKELKLGLGSIFTSCLSK